MSYSSSRRDVVLSVDFPMTKKDEPFFTSFTVGDFSCFVALPLSQSHRLFFSIFFPLPREADEVREFV